MVTIENLTEQDKQVLKVPLETITTGQGVTVKDLRVVDKICLAIESAQDSLDLEDTDYQFLKKHFDNYSGWNPAPEVRKSILEAGEKLK